MHRVCVSSIYSLWDHIVVYIRLPLLMWFVFHTNTQTGTWMHVRAKWKWIEKPNQTKDVHASIFIWHSLQNTNVWLKFVSKCSVHATFCKLHEVHFELKLHTKLEKFNLNSLCLHLQYNGIEFWMQFDVLDEYGTNTAIVNQRTTLKNDGKVWMKAERAITNDNVRDWVK